MPNSREWKVEEAGEAPLAGDQTGSEAVAAPLAGPLDQHVGFGDHDGLQEKFAHAWTIHVHQNDVRKTQLAVVGPFQYQMVLLHCNARCQTEALSGSHLKTPRKAAFLDKKDQSQKLIAT